jgi:heme-degrading monooxygenase HmoA
VRPTPIPGRVGLVATWDDDASLDSFLDSHPLAARFAAGWHTRLEPLRSSGNWPLFGDPSALADRTTVAASAVDEPVAVITYGKLRPQKALSFLRASARAEAAALESPGMIAGTALARPPKIVATFSLWRSAAEMQEYAYRGESHRAAMAGMRQHDFHSDYIFARFRPYGSSGQWDGREPLASSPAAGLGA